MLMDKVHRKPSRALAFLLSSVMALSVLTGCAEKEKKSEDSSNGAESRTGSVTTTSKPEITLTSVLSTAPAPKAEIEVMNGQIDDIYTLVCSSVAEKLSDAGFETCCGYSALSEKDDTKRRGLCYTNDKIKLFRKDDIGVGGFVEIISSELAESSAGIAEDPVVVTVNSGGEDKQYLCAYNYDNIGSSHFVYKGKYVQYRQSSSMRIEYTEMENTEDNYDLELGSLYDYDNKRYLYDESIFSGDYETHKGIGLFKEEDYEELEKSLMDMAKQQEKNGCSVEKCSVVYISPESVQAVIDGKTEDKLFGYSIDELDKTFGKGTELVFENGVPSLAHDDTMSVSGMISGSGNARRFIAGGIIIVSIGVMARSGVSVTKSFISILKNRSFIMAEIKELIESLTEFAAKCSQNLSSGMSISDSLVSAVSEQSGEILDDMLFSAAIVTSSMAMNSISSGYGDKVIEYNSVIKSAWDNFDEIYENAGGLSWDTITDALQGEISLEELQGAVEPDLNELLNENGLVLYDDEDAVGIENSEGTVVELLPSVAEMVLANGS